MTRTEKKKVVFLIDHETLKPYAYFVDEYHDDSSLRIGYTHIGRRMVVDKYFAKNSTLATEQEYNELKEQLRAIGYDLDVQKSKKLI